MKDSYYNTIKTYLIKNEITKRVKAYFKNKSDLNTYYNIGKILVEAGKHYGDGIVKQYSIKLTNELGKNISVTSLKYMRQFYLYSKSQPVADQLTWSHYVEILPIKDTNIRNYYINLCINFHLSKRELRNKIKSKEYERLSFDTKNKLKNKEKITLVDEIKDEIFIRNKLGTDDIKEYALKELILDDISSFMKELGTGFSFIDSEYKIKIGNEYNYIDILLYNYIYRCFVVVELKVTKLKKEHIGQVLIYKNYIDNNIRNSFDNETIGLIVVRENNKNIIRYSTDDRIKVSEYVLV